MRINFAHLCDYALVSLDQKLSVLGIFGLIRPQVIPWPHPQCYLAFEIGLDPAELNRELAVRIQGVDEDGQGLFEVNGQLMPQGQAKIGQYPAIPQVIGFNNLIFARAGAYNINFWLNGNLVHTLHLQVLNPGEGVPLNPPGSGGQ
jgi:hypothetical protein